MAENGYVVGWLKVREVGCGWDGKQLRVVGWESRWDGICRHTTNWQLMGCTNHSDGDGMVACDGNEIPRPIPSHPITIPFVMVISSHRITTHSPEIFGRDPRRKSPTFSARATAENLLPEISNRKCAISGSARNRKILKTEKGQKKVWNSGSSRNSLMPNNNEDLFAISDHFWFE